MVCERCGLIHQLWAEKTWPRGSVAVFVILENSTRSEVRKPSLTSIAGRGVEPSQSYTKMTAVVNMFPQDYEQV